MSFDIDIDAILAAVGAKFVPDGMDRNKLASDLDIVSFALQIYKRHGGMAPESKLQKKLKSVAAAAKRFQSEIGDINAEWSLYLGWPVGPQHVGLMQMMGGVEQLERLAGAAKVPKNSAGLDRSPVETIVKDHLAPIFESHFDRKAGHSVVGEKRVSGPFVRFAVEVLRQYSIDVKPSTIDMAMRSTPRRKKDMGQSSSPE